MAILVGNLGLRLFTVIMMQRLTVQRMRIRWREARAMGIMVRGTMSLNTRRRVRQLVMCDTVTKGGLRPTVLLTR